MSRKTRTAQVLLCILAIIAAPLASANASDAAKAAYATATDATIAAYNTSMDAARAALVTANAAVDAAYGTAANAADAARTTASAAAAAAFTTAMNAAVAALRIAVNAATAAYDTSIAAAAGEPTAVAAATMINQVARQTAESSYTVALSAAQTLYDSASAAPNSEYAIAMAAAEATYTEAHLTANTVFAMAVASAASVCTASGDAADAVYDATGYSGQYPWPGTGCPVTILGPPAKSQSRTRQDGQQVRPNPASYTQVWAGNQVERAFARRYAILDVDGRQLKALTSAVGLFPKYGFAPPSSAGTWSIKGVDDDQSIFCSNVTVRTLKHWNQLLEQLFANGMKPADASCDPAGTFATASSFPHNVHSRKLLDRRDYITPTVTPSYVNEVGQAIDWPVLDGFTKSVALPAVTLRASPGEWSEPASITIFNTPRLIATDPVVQHLATGISAISVREDFAVRHNCDTLPGGQACEVLIWYGGSAPLTERIGTLRIDFKNGKFALISMAGFTRLN